MKKTIRILTIILCLLCIATVCSANEVLVDGSCNCPLRTNEDIITLKNHIIASETNGLLPGDTYTIAKEYADSMLNDGSWADIDYTTQPSSAFPGMEHISRLLVIAKSYYVANQPYYESNEVIETITKGLGAVETKLLKTKDGIRQTPGNWWYWNLAIPPKLSFILFPVEGKIDENIYNTGLESVKWLLNHPQDWDLSGMFGNGANSTWAIKGNLYYYTLMGDKESIKYVSDQFSRNFDIVNPPWEGFLSDGGYRAHVMMDYYGYFRSFIGDAILLLDIFSDTSFEIDKNKEDTFANTIVNGATWTIYQGYRELGLSGRTMWGPFTQNGPLTKDEYGNIIKALKYFAGKDGTYRLAAKDALANITNGTEAKTGFKHFYMGDYSFRKEQDSYVSLRMSSSRNRAAEAFSGAGFTTMFMGDGAMWIYNDASKYFESDFYACMDWNRLAGTTVINGAEPYRFRSYFDRPETFVGGLENGDNGVSAMYASQLSLPLDAQKSWFFFDDEVVCLGSGIKSESEEETHTIIDQRINSGSINVNGNSSSMGKSYKNTFKNTSYITHDNVGYYFPDATDVNIENSVMEGSWYRLYQTSGSQDKLESNVSSLYLNHGSKTDNGNYAYAILPDATVEETKEYAEGSNIEVLSNTNEVHAVKDASTGATGMVFWPGNREFMKIRLGNEDLFQDGIQIRNIASTFLRTVAVEVNGDHGLVSIDNTKNAMNFAVPEQRLSGDVDITVTWFDDSAAATGSYWKIGYLTKDGTVKYSDIVPYRYTDTWTTSKLTLKNAYFKGTGLLEDGIELAILHSGNKFDLSNPKYKHLVDYTTEILTHGNICYGPVVSEITLSPSGKTKPEKYSASFEGISVDAPCIVYTKPTDDGIELSVCEPQHIGKYVTVTLDGNYENAAEGTSTEVSSTNGKTVVKVYTEKGKTEKIALRRK